MMMCLPPQDMNEPANFGTNEAQPWNWPEGRDPWSLSCPDTRWDNPPYVTSKACIQSCKVKYLNPNRETWRCFSSVR